VVEVGRVWSQADDLNTGTEEDWDKLLRLADQSLRTVMAGARDFARPAAPGKVKSLAHESAAALRCHAAHSTTGQLRGCLAYSW
jgi:hypothetical protein